MKKTILSILLLVVVTTVSVAQCDKSYTITSSKTEYFDGTGTLQRSVDEKSLIVVTGKDIVITHGPNEDKMSGSLKYDTCSWKIPFKNGKAVIRTTLMSGDGRSEGVIITIEGTDGKINFTAVPDSNPDRQIRLTIEKFEEKK